MAEGISKPPLTVSARELREAAERAGGFDKLTPADLEKVLRTPSELRENSARTPENSQGISKSKYRNRRVIIGEDKFDSEREANYWAELKLREKAGDISALARQVPYELRCPIDAWPPEREAVVAHYVADFRYCDRDGRVHVVDAKGIRTRMYQLKKKWLELQSGIVIEEV